MVIEEMGPSKELGETFLQYKGAGKVEMDYEIYKDSMFPGMMEER